MQHRSSFRRARAARLLVPTLLVVAVSAAAQPGSLATQRLDQETAGLQDEAENLDLFGDALAVGDFNGDGRDDLAIGVPSEDLEVVGGSTSPGAGAVHVLYGRTDDTLDPLTSQRWTFDSPGLEPFRQANALFGSALVAGDFDGDTWDDLAIAASRYDTTSPSALDAGAVFVLYGSPAGLSTSELQQVSQADPEVDGTAEQQDFFGQVLAAGDLDGDGRDDLAIAVASEAVGDENNAGVVMVFFGSADGLSTADELTIDESDLGGVPDNGSGFGEALLIAPLDDDAFAELVVSSPELSLEIPARGGTFLSDTGTVYRVPGSAGGPLTASTSELHQDVPMVLDERESFDQFGWALAALRDPSDPTGPRRLAVAVYGEDDENGAIHVFGAGTAGPDLSTQQLLLQDSADPSEPVGFSAFGEALAVGDFDGDGTEDLAVSSPSEDLSPEAGQGVVQIFYGSAEDGQLFDLTRFDRLHEGEAPVGNSADSGESFGEALAVGDFDGNGTSDLAVGVPREQVGTPGGSVTAGRVFALYGAADTSRIFADGFESGDAFGWSASAP